MFIVLSSFVDNGINAGDSCDIDNIAYRAFNVGEVNWFVQSHLNRADHFGLTHVLNELIGSIG